MTVTTATRKFLARASLAACVLIPTEGYGQSSGSSGSSSSGSTSSSSSSSTWWQGDPNASSRANLGAYGDYMKKAGEFQRTLAEARLTDARARLTNAVANHQMQMTRQLRLLVDRLEIELDRLWRDEFKYRSRIKIHERYTRDINWLNLGVASHKVWTAWRYFIRDVVPPDVILEIMQLPVPELDSDNFMTKPGSIEYPEMYPGGNVGKLFTWLRRKNYQLEPYADAHLILLAAMGRISEAGHEKLADLERRLRELRDGTFDIWRTSEPDTLPRLPE